VHMRRLGTEAAQIRAGRNLDREVVGQTPGGIRTALRYTEVCQADWLGQARGPALREEIQTRAQWLEEASCD